MGTTLVHEPSHSLIHLQIGAAVMKSTQGIIALGVAAVLVFVGTFLVNYLHSGKTTAQVTAPQAKLTFADLETNFPDQTQPAALEEIGTPKSHAFWFKNDNPTALPVGVFSKTCQCTHVRAMDRSGRLEGNPAAGRP